MTRRNAYIFLMFHPSNISTLTTNSSFRNNLCPLRTFQNTHIPMQQILIRANRSTHQLSIFPRNLFQGLLPTIFTTSMVLKIQILSRFTFNTLVFLRTVTGKTGHMTLFTHPSLGIFAISYRTRTYTFQILKSESTIRTLRAFLISQIQTFFTITMTIFTPIFLKIRPFTQRTFTHTFLSLTSSEKGLLL